MADVKDLGVKGETVVCYSLEAWFMLSLLLVVGVQAHVLLRVIY